MRTERKKVYPNEEGGATIGKARISSKRLTEHDTIKLAMSHGFFEWCFEKDSEIFGK